MNALLEAAVGYAAQGFAVIPLHSPQNGRCSCGRENCGSVGKHPKTEHGVKDASTDVGQIQEWWGRWPDANVGLAMGGEAWALDVDGDAGRASLAKLEHEHGPLPETAHQKTGGDGEHFLFKLNGDPIPNRTKCLPGLDTRGAGGFIVVAPSIHASGDRYSWVTAPGEIELPEAPKWLTSQVSKRKSTPPARRPLRLVPSDAVERCKRYLEKTADAISGNHGHDTTLRAACECFRFGLSDAEAREVMTWFNTSKTGGEPWTDRELEHKLTDARQKVEADGEFGARVTTPEKHTRAAPKQTKAERAQHRTDLGNAELFVAQHGDAVRHTMGQGWLFYDGTRWARDVTGQVPQLAMKTIRKLFEDALRLGDAERKEQITHALKSENAARIAAMLDLARHFSGVAVSDGVFDKSPWLFNTPAGTVEIDPTTGDYRCRKHRPEDLITKVSPVGFDESADCPTFQRFISEIFLHDEDMVAFTQRAMGSCLVGEPEEILHVWFGGGDNGKSTLVDVIRHVLGDYATSLPQAFFGKRIGEAIPTDVMDLRGARLAVSHEPDQRMVLDEAKMKYLTGRDVIKARRLYRDPVEFTPNHKLVLVTNHRPAVQTQTRATWRRICLWPFMFTVPAESKDRALGEKLKAEASGILNWLLVGCSEWVSAGRHCDPPKTVQTATEDYKQAEDVLGDWLAECTENAPERTPFCDLYASYEAWAKARGFEKLFSRRRLSTMLEEHSYQRRTLHGQRLFEGLRCRNG